MIKVINFEPVHMMNIEKRDADSEIAVFMGDMDKRAVAYAEAGRAVTMMDGEEILAVGGIIKFWNGVGECWMMVSPEGRKHGYLLYKHMDGFIEACKQKWGYHRIQASVVEGNRAAHQCAYELGFIPEGMMIHYGPHKENFVRYVQFA